MKAAVKKELNALYKEIEDINHKIGSIKTRLEEAHSQTEAEYDEMSDRWKDSANGEEEEMCIEYMANALQAIEDVEIALEDFLTNIGDSKAE